MKWFFRFILVFLIAIAGSVAYLVLRPPPAVEYELRPEHLRKIGKYERRLAKMGATKDLVTFSQLSNTKIPFSGPIQYPESLKKLEGKTVRMIGFMTPYDDLDILTHFMIMNASVGCNFCEAPEMEEVVFVRQKDPKAEFIEGVILVTGTLKLDTGEGERDPMLDTFYYVIDQAEVESLGH